MEKFQKPLILITVTMVLLFCLIITGLFVLNRLNQPAPGEVKEVNSRIIIEKIQDQAFLVTKTVILDQKAEVKVDQGSAWSNFWWGQSIEADGLIRLDIGVDLSKITEDKVIVNDEKKTVSIQIPDVEILDASQYGDIEVKSSKGVLKFFLDNNPNQDHNEALKELINEAEESVKNDTEIFGEAAQSANEFLELIVKSLGYTLESD